MTGVRSSFDAFATKLDLTPAFAAFVTPAFGQPLERTCKRSLQAVRLTEGLGITVLPARVEGLAIDQERQWQCQVRADLLGAYTTGLFGQGQC